MKKFITGLATCVFLFGLTGMAKAGPIFCITSDCSNSVTVDFTATLTSVDSAGNESWDMRAVGEYSFMDFQPAQMFVFGTFYGTTGFSFGLDLGIMVDFLGEPRGYSGTFDASRTIDHLIWGSITQIDYYGWRVDSWESLDAGSGLGYIVPGFGPSIVIMQEGSEWYGYEQTAPVPEPTTMLLFGTGLAGLAGTRLRRKKKKTS